jgi:type IV secretion system protein VirB6
MACPTLSTDGPFLSDMLGHIDCQAQTLGSSGYHALAAAGSPVSMLLTAVLTLFVALFGYRMLFGQVPSARDGTLALVKVGFVLALATSWSAYRVLAYDVVLHGPAELATTIGGSATLPGAGGGLVARLQGVDDALVELISLGTGAPTVADDAATPASLPTPGQQPITPQQQQQNFQRLQARPHWDPARDATLLGEARTLYLTGAIAAFASVRLVAGLLLALGPLFLLFLLFDATRGLFEGWVRALVGAALGALSTAIVLGVELALAEPWLAAILTDRRADISTPAVPVELLVLTLVFALTLLACLIASARVARGFRMPAQLWAVPHHGLATLSRASSPLPALAGPSVRSEESPERTRARAISDAAAATQRREQSLGSQTSVRLVERGGNPATPARGPETVPTSPIGQTGRRRTTGRVSATANRRNAL